MSKKKFRKLKAEVEAISHELTDIYCKHMPQRTVEFYKLRNRVSDIEGLENDIIELKCHVAELESAREEQKEINDVLIHALSDAWDMAAEGLVSAKETARANEVEIDDTSEDACVEYAVVELANNECNADSGRGKRGKRGKHLCRRRK